MKPTVRDVAKMAGVAPITVSRVVNNTGYVSEETRRRVEIAVRELGYIPNDVSRSLRLQKTNVIALIISDITNPFWTTVTRGVEDATHESGLSIILGNTDEKPEKLDAYVSIMLRQQVDGFLIAPTHENAAAVQAIKDKRVPLVLIDRFANGVQADVVMADSVDGAFRLTEYLIRLGHQRIAILSGPRSASTSQQRRDGYAKAMKANGIPIVPELIFEGEYNQQHGYATAMNIFKDREHMPTALLAMNGQIAAGALHALQELGLDVPGHVSVASFDNPFQGSLYSELFMTVIDQKPYDIGYKAASLLLDFILENADSHNQQFILPVELIVRNSCRAISTS